MRSKLFLSCDIQFKKLISVLIRIFILNMNTKFTALLKFIFICIILLCIYWFIELKWNSIMKENFANSLPVTDQPNPNTPAPFGMFPLSIQKQRSHKYLVEDNLMPGPRPSYCNFQIVPQPPPWRIPVHPLVPPPSARGGSGIATYMGLYHIDLPWLIKLPPEFDEKMINDWVKATSEPIDWPKGITDWKWQPYPNKIQIVEKWHDDLWKNAPWRPPIDSAKDNQAPPPPTIPDLYWRTWATHWLNQWNSQEVNSLQNEIPKDRQPRSLEYPFQYGRLWYVQGWDANVHDGKKVRIIQYFGELVRPFGQVVYIMDWIMVGNPDNMNEAPLINVAWIGSREYQQVWMPDGFDSTALMQRSTTPANPPPNQITMFDIPKELKQRQLETEFQSNVREQFVNQDENVQSVMNKMHEGASKTRHNNNYAYQCFIASPSSYHEGALRSNLMFASSKEECENRLDFLGKEKPKGVWDRPCRIDDDCLFYKSNKNYPNSYGKCLNTGTCSFPIGMEPLGHRYFITSAEAEPYCYNCDSDKWFPDTELGKCCEAQQDRERYPFLDSPDYAFVGDTPQRERYYNQNMCLARGKQQISNKEYEKKIECTIIGEELPQLYPTEQIRKKIDLVPIPEPVRGLSYSSSFDKQLGIPNVPGQTNATFINTTARTANT